MREEDLIYCKVLDWCEIADDTNISDFLLRVSLSTAINIKKTNRFPMTKMTL